MKGKLIMDEFKFESLTALYERLFPAFNTKCNELKRNNINVTELDLWNFLKDNKWNNSKELSMAGLVDDILNINVAELITYLHKEGGKNDN